MTVTWDVHVWDEKAPDAKKLFLTGTGATPELALADAQATASARMEDCVGLYECVRGIKL